MSSVSNNGKDNEALGMAGEGERNMLVLTRKKNETIVIGENIVVMVIEVRGDRVRLGIDAPKEVSVYRHELYEAIKRGEVVKEGNIASER
jgi:carbon storage regulator